MVRLFYILIAMLLFSCNKASGDLELCGSLPKPYYFTGLQYKGEMYAIKKAYHKTYIPVKGEGNSGIVKIRFDVNCLGETGNFKVETYSLDYQLTTLNDSIVSQTLSIAKGLDEWIPGKNDEGENIDSFKFIAIKLVDGEIREILPK